MAESQEQLVAMGLDLIAAIEAASSPAGSDRRSRSVFIGGNLLMAVLAASESAGLDQLLVLKGLGFSFGAALGQQDQKTAEMISLVFEQACGRGLESSLGAAHG
jgi:hypothetical protein